MAELAAGAVNTLLGVIRNEALLLGRVGDDVQFIKEEMESMNSFLAHLARTAPPGGEHDEQVCIWMNQVRVLAQDCNNCIDLYLYRGNPDIHRARGGLRRYLWWVPWFLQKMVAQHRVAIQLRQLKERARDVGERRLRYGVEVPEKTKVGQSPPAAGRTAPMTPSSSSAPAAAAGDDEEDGDDQLVVATATDHYSGRRAIFEHRTMDDYFKGKLVEWIKEFEEDDLRMAESTPSIAIVAPGNDQDALALAHETLTVEGTYFDRRIFVDILAVHLKHKPLRPKEILYYILRELEREEAKSQSQQQRTDQGEAEEKWSIYERKRDLIFKIRGNIQEMKRELENIKSNLRDWQLNGGQQQLQLDLEKMKDVKELNQKPLHVLLHVLLQSTAVANQQDQVRNKAMRKLATWYNDIIEITAEKLGEHMAEAAEEARKKQQPSTRLYDTQYERILREVFPMTSNSKKPLQTQEQEIKQARNTNTSRTTMAEDQIKEMINKVTEMLQELQEDKTGEPNGIPEADFEQKIKEIKRRIKEQMKIKWIVDRIEDHLFASASTLIILRIGEMINGSTWEDNRVALSLLGWSIAGVLILTTTKSIQQAKEYCYPPREPIEYSLAGFYHDIVLKLTSQQKNEDNYNPQIFHDILDECEPHEFCMKIFTHALCAKPKRSNEELHKLHSTLQAVSPKTLVSIAKKMFRFSYIDMPKEYKSCLLYLAIFPQGHNITRSTLIGRWVAEGLITKEDWPTSVLQAERCFDALIDRWLVYPGYIGATGKAKSCVVGGPVHGFITNIARKQHIVRTRLSLHLARHFSIFNDVQLRGSDRIEKFLKRLSESSRLSLLKVLDLEGCHCFSEKNQRYLKDICSKILLLKYLSLRGTNITELPREINNLHELEVLDIRRTKVPASTTKHVLLLKLKRLLAGGNIHPSPTATDINMIKEFSSVCIPYKIKKMVHMEVLSNVRASQNAQELKDIRNLWQLRKLGVVIDDTDNHLRNLLRAISDQHECLQSLSITLPITLREDTPSIGELPDDISSHLKYSPEVLESLSICGTTQKGKLLPSLSKDGNQLAKVTLSRTWMNQADLKVLAKLPKLLCVRLRNKAYVENMLTFKKDEFQNLKNLLVEGSNMTEISFEDGATPDIEKIVLSFTNIGFIAGLNRLPKLKEVELNNNRSGRLFSSFDDAKQIAKLTLRGTLLEQGDLQILAKKPNIRCLVLLDKSCDKSQLTFNKDEFPTLNLLIVNCNDITNISFTDGSAPKLEKIVWSFTKMESLSGINNLPKLKELEFSGDFVPDEVVQAITEHKNRPSLIHNKPENQD
ncbi:hypothetical protein ACP70R_034861 [Stipagrostis hirtigluma subsp. patula]